MSQVDKIGMIEEKIYEDPNHRDWGKIYQELIQMNKYELDSFQKNSLKPY